MRQIEDDVEKWKSLIGSIILKFGEIELATYQLWVYYGGQIKDAPKEFKPRNNKVIGLVDRDEEIDALTKENLKQYLVGANRLSEMRNEVAHNPIQINIYKHPESENIIECVEINSVFNNRIISFDDLTHFLNELEPLTEKIYEVIPLPLLRTGSGDI